MQIKKYQQIIENGRAPFESYSNRLDSKRAHPKSFFQNLFSKMQNRILNI